MRIKVGSDFSGVGAFNQALKRLNIDYDELFACDMDKYTRKTFIHNYGMPKYYPENVYDREIPSESLDIYMTSPPCQAFSLAGKRLGKDDHRGILFFNSLEFIKINKPRYFIFENVKGLLSDDNGKTFSEWINLLGGKSINSNVNLFPMDDSVPYHIYYKILNAKDFGVPQNRERVFIVGVRDDQDNCFRFPKEERLIKKLKDLLEENVNEKYFLSEKMIKVLQYHNNPIIKNETPEKSACIHAGYFKMGGRDQQYLKIKSNNKKGYELADNYIAAIRKRCENLKKLEINESGISNINTSVNNNNVLGISVHPFSKKLEFKEIVDISPTILATDYKAPKTIHYTDFKIRRLTPRECLRLMDFPDDFDISIISDTQAYKQAGNSIVVSVLENIIKNLKL